MDVKDPNESAVTHLAHALTRKELEIAALKAEIARLSNEIKRLRTVAQKTDE